MLCCSSCNVQGRANPFLRVWAQLGLFSWYVFEETLKCFAWSHLAGLVGTGALAHNEQVVPTAAVSVDGLTLPVKHEDALADSSNAHSAQPDSRLGPASTKPGPARRTPRWTA